MSQDTINKINALKSQGLNEIQVIQTLQEQGLTPREINDSLAQSKIKDAINDPYAQQYLGGQEGQENSQSYEQYGEMEGMQPSVTDTQYLNQNQYPPQTEQQYQEGSQGYDQGYEQQYYPENYQSQGYPQQPGEQGGEAYYGLNTETMSEIAEQLIQEKLATINSAITSLAEFKILVEGKVDKIDSRLERIEKIIDSLQTSLIRRSTESSQDLEDIKTEMKMMQTSFGKVINPMVDNLRESNKSHHKTKTHHKKATSSKKSKR